MAASASTDTTRSIERAVDVLDCFIDAPAELGVTEISRRLGLSKGTIHRLLASLEKGGLIVSNPQTQRYGLGMKILALAGALQQHLDIRRLALPCMHEFARLSGETVSLHVRVGDGQVCIDQVISNQEVRRIVDVGVSKPLHTGSSGKVLLAFSTPDDQERYLSSVPLEALTAHTVVDPERLRGELEEIRRRGYSTSHDEHAVGAAGMAIPVFDHTGSVAAAIVISGPSNRLTRDTMQALAPEVLAIGDRLSRSLGYRAIPLRETPGACSAIEASAPQPSVAAVTTRGHGNGRS